MNRLHTYIKVIYTFSNEQVHFVYRSMKKIDKWKESVNKFHDVWKLKQYNGLRLSTLKANVLLKNELMQAQLNRS